MTQVRAGRGESQGGQPSRDPQGEQPSQGEGVMAGGSSYLDLLQTPGALRFSAAAFVGRMPMSMFGLGIVLFISAGTGRYGLAGVVAAAGAVGYAICAPLVAALTDRLGQRRVLRPQTAVFAGSTVAFLTCVQLHAPVWALLASGTAAGASMPSLGSMVRARWSALVTSSQLETAFALESVADEIIFVLGPALVTVLATGLFPAAGVTAAVLLCVTGTLLLAAQRGTEPAPRPRERRPPGRGLRARRLRLPAPGLITLAPLFLFLGAMFAAIDLSTVDFAQQHGHKPLAGIVLGTYALGSAIGGLWYGSRSWRVPLERRFASTLCLTVAGVATFWAIPSLALLAVVIFFAGTGIAPTLMAGFGLIERQAPAGRRTEAMAWLSSTVSVGVAAGSAVAGKIIDFGGASRGYLFAAGCGVAACAVCLTGLQRLRVTAPAAAVPSADSGGVRATGR